MSEAPKRPIVRYHGGKWKMAPWIISQFPAHRTYVEPFGGGASVLIRKPRSYAEVYNDLDGDMVNLFRMVRDRGVDLAAKVNLTPFARDEFEEAYRPTEDCLEQARRTLIRCGMGFGSTGANTQFKTGFRGSAVRSGSTPSMDWARLPDNLLRIIERLQGVTIENRPAIDVLTYHDAPDALHYVDPPYVHSTRKIGNPYCKKGYRHEMTDDDHRELAIALAGLKGAVIVSGYPCPLYDEIYAGWPTLTHAAFADKAKPRTECIWLRNVSLSPTLL